MGVDPISLGIIGGGAALSGIGGAVKGAKGTPEQVQTSTQSTSFAGPGAKEQQLQSEALKNYFRNQDLANATEQRLGGLEGLQGQAQDVYGSVLSGQAFGLTPQEQASIQASRDALVQQGTEGVNRVLDERLQQVLNQGAGARGLRGQALGALQGQVLKAGANSLTDIQNQANIQAAQAAQNIPLARIQAQQGFASQGLSYADQLRQQAIQNREALANPALLQALQRERMAAGTTTNRQVTPGQKGGFGQALLGGLGGAISGATSGANLYGGIQNIGLRSELLSQLKNSVPGQLNPEGNQVQFPRQTDEPVWKLPY